MGIDPTSYTPIYQQLADVLRDKIERGVYAPGQLLPSEGRLMQEYGASRDATRKALSVLRQEGRVVTERGVGTYVRKQEETTVVRLDATAQAQARMPTANERRRLVLPEGTPVVVISRPDQDDEVLPADRTILRCGKD